ncbi:hypothetical protein LVJ94_29195 [Pendulispora rubella]|uniref:Galactose oxidase n=1 Tax=Pendulispora rubella TaxID=2741070 RepID=A0ABZ2KQQ1_9BACT
MNDIQSHLDRRWPFSIVGFVAVALIASCASPSDYDPGRWSPSPPVFYPGYDGGISQRDGSSDAKGCLHAVNGACTCDGGTCERQDKFVVFGGRNDDDGYLDSTWEWDGNTWFQRNTAGPSARMSTAATLGNKVVLFGGTSDSALGETWEWDGHSWGRRLAATEPPKRMHGAMATLDVNVVLFGGENGNATLHDTWEWNGTTWTERNVAGAPLARSGHAMATLGNKVVLFGGRGERVFDDTWEWNGTCWTQLNVTGPKPRDGHAMATFGNKVILFGGYGVNATGSTTRLDDTWEWDGTTWTQRSPAVAPKARELHGMGTLEGKVLLFAGSDVGESSLTYFNDLWEWDGTTWSKRNVGTAPSARHGSAAAILP